MPVSSADVHLVGTNLWQGKAIPKASEPCVRIVAGRAYYSAFLSTREALRAAYGDASYDVQHRALASAMIGSGHTDLRIAGLMLKELREARETADYELAATMSHTEAEVLLDNAQDVITLAPQLEAGFRTSAVRVPRRL